VVVPEATETSFQLLNADVDKNNNDNSNTPILDRFLSQNGGGGKNKSESYLPTLQALPGRFEFYTYLPSNTQGVLILPVTRPGNGNDGGSNSRSSNDGKKQEKEKVNDDDGTAVLVLGANTARSFSPRDIAWCQVVATRMDSFRERRS